MCFLRTCSHVSLTLLADFSSCLTLVVVILLSVSHVLITCSHLLMISCSEWVRDCITHSHLSTHMRWVASDMRIWSSHIAPLGGSCRFPFISLGLTSMLPQPRVIPKDISGQKRGLCDTGLCLPGFSGLVGSVSGGEPAPISAGRLGAESADGCVVIRLLMDVDGLGCVD